MARRKKTNDIISGAREALSQYHPMTVRQVYYRLVSQHIIENKRSQYQAVSRALVAARQEGIIPWDWIEDRLRLPRSVSMWNDLSSFARTVRSAYRRNVWANQPSYIECWLEKDALSGIFLDVLRPYGVTLNVGRGYDGWSSIRRAADRYTWRVEDSIDTSILYFGDFDPSGIDIVRSLGKRLHFFYCYPEIEVCALKEEDIYDYNLPPDFTKKTDSRSPSFVAQYGDVAVELDALPIEVLQARIKEEVEARMDLEVLEETQMIEKSERRYIVTTLSNFG